jgi:hypothetical protein
MKTVTPSTSRLDSRLAAYAAVATAALAAPALPSADASIVWSGPVSINIPSTTAGIYLNVVTGVFGTAPALVAGWDVNPFSSTTMSFFAPANVQHGFIDEFPGGNSLTLVDNLANGTLISAATQATVWTTNGAIETAGTTAFNLSSSNNIAGFRFLNETTGIVNFGWMRVSLASTANGQPRAIVEYAYENTGAAIGAGVVPEPSTYALFGVVAAGAAGLRAWRRRKAA